jgi:AraC-like DNA-binding protein
VIDNLLTWSIFLRCVVPMLVATVFFTAFVYFSLERHRFGSSYYYFVVFFVTFIFYLCGPAFNILPIEYAKPYIQLGRTILFFWLGLPSLLIALFRFSNVTLPKSVMYFSYSFGLAFSVCFLVLTELAHPKINVLKGFGLIIAPIDWLKLTHIYSFQIVTFVVLLIIPCFYLLQHIPKAQNKGYIYSAISLGFIAVLGSMAEHWITYYSGTSLCGLIWLGAMFKDIQTVYDEAKTKNDHTIPLQIKNSQDSQIISFFKADKGSVSRQVHPPWPVPCKSKLQEQDSSESKESKAEQVKINNCVVQNAMLYIENNYFNDINIDTVAFSVGVSRSYLVKQFKLATNKTINNRIIEVRIEQAKKVLLKKSVTETAYEVGFNNSNYFATVFKKRTNYTPKQFKRTFSS